MNKEHELLIEEIRESRIKNSEEHKEIKKSADVSMTLAKDIQSVIDDFRGFRKTLVFVRNTIFTIGALYLIFKDPINKIIG